MTLLRDKESCWYLLAVSLLCLCIMGCGILFCMGQARAAHVLVLEREQAIAGGLLAAGVPQETIAAAFRADSERAAGRELLARMGRTEHTPGRLLPDLQAFQRNAFLGLLPGSGLCVSLVLAAAVGYLLRLDSRYRRAERTVRCFAGGDFSAHLPRAGEGTLARLFAAVDDLAGALRAKGETECRAKEFLKATISDISHQLKTPLAALWMYHEIMEDEPGNAAVVAEFSQKMKQALGRMEGLIQSLLKITRLDAGGIVFERERIRVADLIGRALGELGTRANLEQVRVTLEGSLEETIVCDPAWTSEALSNLIKNALDYTPPGGEIVIAWEHNPAITRITVSDSGCGIAAEDIHHIFKRFYRSRHSLDHQGVGLGLPLAKAIVEGQGGILSVKSAPGQGTMFTASFLTKS